MVTKIIQQVVLNHLLLLQLGVSLSYYTTYFKTKIKFRHYAEER
jgi:hypothetical protein